jgi:hypothetical protein
MSILLRNLIVRYIDMRVSLCHHFTPASSRILNSSEYVHVLQARALLASHLWVSVFGQLLSRSGQSAMDSTPLFPPPNVSPHPNTPGSIPLPSSSPAHNYTAIVEISPPSLSTLTQHSILSFLSLTGRPSLSLAINIRFSNFSIVRTS